MQNPFGGAPAMVGGGIALQNIPEMPRENGLQNMINDMFKRATDFFMLHPLDPFGNTTTFRKEAFDSVLRELKFAVIGVMRMEAHVLNTIVLPTRVTDTLVVKTEYIEFIPVMPQAVPEGGLGPLLQQRRHTSETRLEQHKLAFKISREFESLDIGEWHVMMNVAQLAAMYIKYHAHMALAALMIPSYQAVNLAERQLQRIKIEDRIIADCRDFAYIHKYQNGFARRVHQVADQIFEQCGEYPTFGFFPKGRKNLIRSMDSATNFSIAGPDGPERLWGTGAELTPVGRVRMYEIPEVPVEFRGDESQLSSYPVIGEYFRLKIFPEMEPEGKIAWRLYNQYTDHKTWVELKTFVESSAVWIKVFGEEGAEDRYQINWYGIRKISQAHHMTDRELFRHSPSLNHLRPRHDATDQELIRHTAAGPQFTLSDIAKKFDVLNFRFMYYRMEDAVLAVPGPETGETLVNVGELVRGSDAGTGMDLVNSTEWSAIHIANPNRFKRIANCCYAGILGGGNVAPLVHRFEWRGNQIKETQNDVQDFINAKYRRQDLSKPTMFVMFIAKDETFEERPFHFTNGYHPDQSLTSDSSSWPNAYWYSTYQGFQKTEKFTGVTTFKPRTGAWEAPIAVFRGGVGFMGRGNLGLVEIPGETHHGSWEDNGAREVRRTGMTQYKVLTDRNEQ